MAHATTAAGGRGRRGRQRLASALAAILALAALAVAAVPAAAETESYRNPLTVRIPGSTARVESCADPSLIKGQQAGDPYWYMYCTSDPLHDDDRNAEGGFNFRLIPVLRSKDLIHWVYMGDALTARPAWAADGAGIWAPEIEYYPEQDLYHLYYTVTDTDYAGGGSAIGVAISRSPIGPFRTRSMPVVEPHAADCCPGSRRHVFDPEVFRTAGADYIYYGSYFGGVSVRRLSENGFVSDKTTQSNVAIANKFEGPEVIKRGPYYYLFVSATDCCRGPLTGYSVYVGRSTSPTGPFIDRQGRDLNDDEGPNENDPTTGRAGGTPVLSMNGNRWVGPGHNSVFLDYDGQWWTVYHAINRSDPYFQGGVDLFDGNCGAEGQAEQPCGDLNKRPVLLDPIDWNAGWPLVRNGRFISDRLMQAPAAQPGETTEYDPLPYPQDQLGDPIFTEGFSTAPGPEWSWVRPPDPATYGTSGGTFRFEAQEADLFVDSDNASVLVRNAPLGSWAVETKVQLNVPAEGCCFNYTQAGLVIYLHDDEYVKLVHASIWNTRQTEFAKEISDAQAPEGYPRYGNTVVGPPGNWTWLRIVKRELDNEELYTAFTSLNGTTWVRGGTWTHRMGDDLKIGLVSMAEPGPEPDGTNQEWTARFDYVRAWRVEPDPNIGVLGMPEGEEAVVP